MLLVEFALAYGNDWFVIPIEVDVGSLHRTRSLVVTDTFGVRTLIKPASLAHAVRGGECFIIPFCAVADSLRPRRIYFSCHHNWSREPAH